MQNELSLEELQRYSRHFNLKEVGIAGQQKLKVARVLCVGAGGLGSPLLLYLAAAGVGTIGIVDADVIEASNLQRQVLYTQDKINTSKAEAAKDRLLALNPHIKITIHPVRLTAANALDIIKDYDVVADGTDNFATRYTINDACFHLNKPNVYASIYQFEGQCSVFTTQEGPCYRCLYPAPPPSGLVPNCADAGVLGVLPGVMGSIQALEVIKLILGIGKPLIGRLLTFDALTTQFCELAIQRSSNCSLCIHKQPFASLPHHDTPACELPVSQVNEISVQELQRLQQTKADFLLLDVREPFEYSICNLNGYLIPLKELSLRIHELDRSKRIIVHCKSGGRSSRAVQLLKAAGFDALNLHGGILAWQAEIDPTMSIY